MDVRTVDGALTRELRRRVLRATQPPQAAMPGDDQPEAVHVAAFDGARVVGTCFVFPQECDWRPETPAWQVRSMAVDPAWQGRGVGRAVLERALAECGDAAISWCHARESATGFWVAAGFADRRPEGDPRTVYVEAETGIPHRDMWRPLRRWDSGTRLAGMRRDAKRSLICDADG